MRLNGLALLCVCVLSACADTSYLPQFVTDTFDSAARRDDPSVVESPEYYEVSPDGYNSAAVQVVAAEDLLDADGNWYVVEQGRALDPATAHLAARNRVDTKRRKPIADLTAHFEPDAKSGQDGTLRILRIEAKEEDADFDIAEGPASVSQPVAKDSEAPSQNYNDVIPVEDFGRKKSGFLGLKAIFAKGKDRGVPMPGRKPGAGGLEMVKSDAASNVQNKIIPPELPSFRRPPKALVEVKGVVSDVIIPRRKPSVVQPEALKIASSQPKPKVKVSERRDAVSNVTSRALKIRSGRHPGRTRLVLEVSKVTKYKVAIDSIRNVLRIKMASTQWDMNPQGVLRGSKLFGTYIARDLKDGSVLLEIRLSEKTKVLNTLVLPPNGSAKNRIVIDLED